MDYNIPAKTVLQDHASITYCCTLCEVSVFLQLSVKTVACAARQNALDTHLYPLILVFRSHSCFILCVCKILARSYMRKKGGPFSYIDLCSLFS